MKEIIGDASIAFLLKIIGSGLAFAFSVAVTRLLGAEGAGIYFLALSMTMIGSVLGRVGLDNTLLRFTATHATKGEWPKVQGVYSIGMRISFLVSGALSLLCFLVAPWLAVAIFRKPTLAEPLRWMSLAILPFALLNLQAESLKGLKSVRIAVMLQNAAVPFIGLLFIWPFAIVAGVKGVALTYLSATILVTLMGKWAWRRALPRKERLSVRYPFADIWASCKPLLFTSLMNRAVLPWAPLFLLGLWASNDEVGIFGAASRVAILISFALVTINNVLAPKFVELYTKGEMEALGRTARRSSMLITFLASPIFLVLIFGGKHVMTLFGPRFEDGAMFLAILAIGQWVNVSCGSVGYLLNMSGNERSNAVLTAFSGGTLLVLSVVLIPFYGALGAAVASSCSLVLFNALATLTVWRKLGISASWILQKRFQ